MIYLELEKQLQHAVAQVVPDADLASVLVRPCPDPKFGDYQTNALMSLAKARKLNPRKLAEDVMARLDLGQWCDKMEIAGAGFINFHLKPGAVADEVRRAAVGEHLFYQKTSAPKTIVLDFSSPNVAKPMHVGHIRSTILGDSMARVFRLLGHRVITDNHIGDWGTQFGKVIVGWKQQLDRAALEADPLSEMERLYKTINTASENDPSVMEQARQELVKLQNGDAENLAIWREMLALSQHQFDAVYDRLGVKFDHALGESFYNPQLKRVVQELVAAGVARESEGAICVFSAGSLPPKEDPFLIQRDGEWAPNPALIQKSDGGFNYATTDLATIEHRLKTWQPADIIYFTDGGQQLHFRQVFAAYRRWQPGTKVHLEHVWFGKILGEDGKPFRTRSGETVKLLELLEEAQERAFQVVTGRSGDVPESTRREIARVVGISAVKYADLLPNRQTDYVFSWDKMLALTGNTAVYLLYAYARIRNIFRKAEERGIAFQVPSVELNAPEEVRLAKALLNFGRTLEAVAAECRPNLLCNYLYDLAGLYAAFYEQCPVLDAPEPTRSHRFALCDATGKVLKQGLELLGIPTIDRM